MTTPTAPRRALFARFTLLTAFASAACAASEPYLAVIEKPSGIVGFYSESGEDLAQAPVGSFPHEAVLSPDSRRLIRA